MVENVIFLLEIRREKNERKKGTKRVVQYKGEYDLHCAIHR